MINEKESVSVFAPATSANVAVGFDILGFAVAELGDEVTLIKSPSNQLEITSILGASGLPYEVDKNTATVALSAMLAHLNIKQGFQIHIKKNIPLSSGLGGSAACSVAAVVALNHFLIEPLKQEELIDFALTGEEAACGARHGDNVIPCLLGGLNLVCSLMPLDVIQLPILPLEIILIHPHKKLDTRKARAVLPAMINLSLVTKQNAHCAAFISALYEGDYERLARACVDELIEPQRAPLIPHFYETKEAAYQNGALACSISGSGPTLFAFSRTKAQAKQIAFAMQGVLAKHQIESDVFLSSITTNGARVINEQ
jgi:homoserine kinase